MYLAFKGYEEVATYVHPIYNYSYSYYTNTGKDTTIVDPDILAAYSTAHNLTVFNGEELKVKFKGQYATSQFSSAALNSNIDGVHGSGVAGFVVKLIDRTGSLTGTPGSITPSSYVHVPNSGVVDASLQPYERLSMSNANQIETTHYNTIQTLQALQMYQLLVTIIILKKVIQILQK